MCGGITCVARFGGVCRLLRTLGMTACEFCYGMSVHSSPAALASSVCMECMQVIKRENAKDLGTMSTKLSTHEYSSPQEFYDVRLRPPASPLPLPLLPSLKSSGLLGQQSDDMALSAPLPSLQYAWESHGAAPPPSLSCCRAPSRSLRHLGAA